MLFAASQSETIFEIVCDDCQIPCTECDFGEDSKDTPRCKAELENSESAGGNETLETLSINEGYWRATNTSEIVRECYNTDACAGGQTGNDEYCKDGYRGPCEKHVISLGWECCICLKNLTMSKEYCRFPQERVSSD